MDIGAHADGSAVRHWGEIVADMQDLDTSLITEEGEIGHQKPAGSRVDIIGSKNVGDHRLKSLFSSPPWLDALQVGYGIEIQAAVCHPPDQPAQTILFSAISDIRGERVVSLPFSDYCDPLVDDQTSWRELIRPILAFDRPTSFRCLKNQIPSSDVRFDETGRAMWHAVDLTPTEEQLWAGLAASARQNIRRARRHDVVVRASRSIDDIRRFHQLHCHLRKLKYRLLAQPLLFFDALHHAFSPKDQITVLLAEVEGNPIAGILLLEWGDTIYYKFNASIDQKYRPNDLLAWEAILWGHHRGLANMDFGLSDKDQPGLIRYKEKFASTQDEIVLLRWTPPDYQNAAGSEASDVLGQITRLLTDPKVPDDVTRAAGDMLYRYFC